MHAEIATVAGSTGQPNEDWGGEHPEVGVDLGGAADPGAAPPWSVASIQPSTALRSPRCRTAWRGSVRVSFTAGRYRSGVFGRQLRRAGSRLPYSRGHGYGQLRIRRLGVRVSPGAQYTLPTVVSRSARTDGARIHADTDVTVSDVWARTVVLCVCAVAGNFSLEVAGHGTHVMDPPTSSWGRSGGAVARRATTSPCRCTTRQVVVDVVGSPPLAACPGSGEMQLCPRRADDQIATPRSDSRAN